MDPAEVQNPPPAGCVSCGRALKPDGAFCSACGHRRGEPAVDRERALRARVDRVRRHQSGWEGIRTVLLFYFLLVGAQAATFAVGRASDEFVADLVGTSLMSLIVVVVVLRHRQALRESWRRPGFGLAGYGLILLASVPIMAAVCSYSLGLGRLFRLPPPSTLDLYRGHGLLWAYLLVAVVPPVVEELGFRGAMYQLLARSLDPGETILLSAAAFGILHLAIPTLITHIPLGLYLGWLRHRSGSLYPSIFAHFLHNGLVLTAEAARWLPGAG